jgi:hypothetical protein
MNAPSSSPVLTGDELSQIEAFLVVGDAGPSILVRPAALRKLVAELRQHRSPPGETWVEKARGWLDDETCPPAGMGQMDFLIQSLARLLESVALQEREKAAKIAEELAASRDTPTNRDWGVARGLASLGTQIALTIRAQGKEE